MFLRFKTFEPSRSFQFKDPDTGFIHTAKNFKQLCQGIIKYREQNELEEIEEIEFVVENYLCGLPENCNSCVERKGMSRSFMQYVKGGVMLLKNAFFQEQVAQDVAEKRAAQCVTCKFNIFPDKGPFIAWSDDVAIQQVGERRVSVHNQLGNCDICSCALKSKIFFGGKLPRFNEEEVKKLESVNCWQIALQKDK